MSEAVRFGLVGGGAIAQAYAAALDAVEGVELAAVADIRGDAARSMGEAFSCKSFESHGAMIEAGVDAAVVCTPPNTHESICTDLLRAKVPTLCEKPLSVTTSSARRMVGAAREAGVLLSMASKFRFVEDVMKAHHLMVSGTLGEIILFENAFTARVDMTQRWNSDPKISGGGVLIDNGTHSVDLVHYFLGPIEEVLVVEGRRMQAIEVEDTARMHIRSAGGVVGTIDLSWTLNKELASFIDIYGSEGTVRVGWKGSRLRQTSNPGWTDFGSGYDKHAAFRNQVNDFAGAVRGDHPPRVSPEQALSSVQVIDAAYQSMRSGTWTKVGSAA